jgi:hypothetical protein
MSLARLAPALADDTTCERTRFLLPVSGWPAS